MWQHLASQECWHQAWHQRLQVDEALMVGRVWSSTSPPLPQRRWPSILSSLFMTCPNSTHTCWFKNAAGPHQPCTCAGLFTFTIEAAVAAADCVGNCIGGEVCNSRNLKDHSRNGKCLLQTGSCLTSYFATASCRHDESGNHCSDNVSSRCRNRS